MRVFIFQPKKFIFLFFVKNANKIYYYDFTILYLYPIQLVNKEKHNVIRNRTFQYIIYESQSYNVPLLSITILLFILVIL